jgi:hypothetical protein
MPSQIQESAQLQVMKDYCIPPTIVNSSSPAAARYLPESKQSAHTRQEKYFHLHQPCNSHTIFHSPYVNAEKLDVHHGIHCTNLNQSHHQWYTSWILPIASLAAWLFGPGMAVMIFGFFGSFSRKA